MAPKSSSQYRPFDPNESVDAIGMTTIAGRILHQTPNCRGSNKCIKFADKQSTGFIDVIRGRPYMTSAKFSGFRTPSPLVCIWD